MNSKFVFPTDIKDYKILDEITRSEDFIVHHGICTVNNEEVTLKVFELDNIQLNMDSIINETKIISNCNHPNIVKYYTSFINNTKLYIITKYLEIGSVHGILRYKFPKGLDSEEIIAIILKSVLKGLEYAHKHGIIHRDIRASTILVDKNGVVQISDFGVGSYILENNQKKCKTFRGTLNWMAPEVLEQVHDYDFKVDIWSFGITAIELATGLPPYHDKGPVAIFFDALNKPPPQLKTQKKFSKNFYDVIESALKKDPKDRPSATQLLKHKFFQQVANKDSISLNFFKGWPSLQHRVLIVKGLEAYREQKNKKKNLNLENQNKDEGDNLVSEEDLQKVENWNFENKKTSSKKQSTKKDEIQGIINGNLSLKEEKIEKPEIIIDGIDQNNQNIENIEKNQNNIQNVDNNQNIQNENDQNCFVDQDVENVENNKNVDSENIQIIESSQNIQNDLNNQNEIFYNQQNIQNQEIENKSDEVKENNFQLQNFDQNLTNNEISVPNEISKNEGIDFMNDQKENNEIIENLKEKNEIEEKMEIKKAENEINNDLKKKLEFQKKGRFTVSTVSAPENLTSNRINEENKKKNEENVINQQQEKKILDLNANNEPLSILQQSEMIIGNIVKKSSTNSEILDESEIDESKRVFRPEFSTIVLDDNLSKNNEKIEQVAKKIRKGRFEITNKDASGSNILSQIRVETEHSVLGDYEFEKKNGIKNGIVDGTSSDLIVEGEKLNKKEISDIIENSNKNETVKRIGRFSVENVDKSKLEKSSSENSVLKEVENDILNEKKNSDSVSQIDHAIYEPKQIGRFSVGDVNNNDDFENIFGSNTKTFGRFVLNEIKFDSPKNESLNLNNGNIITENNISGSFELNKKDIFEEFERKDNKIDSLNFNIEANKVSEELLNLWEVKKIDYEKEINFLKSKFLIFEEQNDKQLKLAEKILNNQKIILGDENRNNGINNIDIINLFSDLKKKIEDVLLENENLRKLNENLRKENENLKIEIKNK